jgi:hypothetical protein
VALKHHSEKRTHASGAKSAGRRRNGGEEAP